jgi:HPr kinase/phosphorylase
VGLTVRQLLELRGRSLELQLLTPPDQGLDREIRGPDLSSPGLALAGFTDRVAEGRLQVLGETEIAYLRSRKPEERRRAIETLLAFDTPCLFVTKALEPPPELVELAAARGVPVLQSALKTQEFYRRIHPFLEEQFAPQTTLHGSLVDVYGVGLLFVGRSGIGKSECALDLVERGHRLVADDVVQITRRGNDILIGRGLELQKHRMEIRGIGIIDVRALFGIRAVRQQKRIEVVVQLVDWNDRAYYDRTGLDAEETEILGVKLPKLTIPLNPGKNITVISEVIAMNHLLKYAGVHSAEVLERELLEAMRPLREYLEEDYE